MQLFIRPGDYLPIYRQIMRQIMDAIAGGRLASGEQLPSHRELSEQLVIAPLTVKKAYDELEALGYIETQRGRGTYVAARLPRGATAAQASQLEATARGLVSQAYLAGMQLSDVVQLIKDADRAISAAPTLDHRKEGRKR
ncbi:GntR family transcriptional regulator [Gemmatimonas sp.]|uniref:GntR family transcriptional regulator n=1 Tax=Gemmatimonas sp. TaxID=1962908 RepID=UPI00286A8F83|nr:GntR family transcriptional regulator [Gemmatimonas sp.]